MNHRSAVLAVLAWAGLLLPSSAREIAVLRCELGLRVDTDTKAVRGSAAVEVEARGEPAQSARFSLNDALAVSAITRDGKPAKFALGSRIAEGRSIEVVLDPPLAAGGRCRLEFEYAGVGDDPDEHGQDWMGILLVRDGEIRMSHQAQWHPIVPRDESARSKWPSAVKLELDLPAGFESLGPGKLAGVKKHKGREIHTWTSDRPVTPSLLAGRYKAQSVKRDRSLCECCRQRSTLRARSSGPRTPRSRSTRSQRASASSK